MRFSFTEDQLLFRDTVRDILAGECPPDAVRASWDSVDGRVPGLWQTLAETGVIGLTAPESDGGLGMGEVELVGLLEEAGAAAMPDPLVEHTAVAIPALVDAGGPLAEQWLEPAASGAALLTARLEPDTYVLAAASADAMVIEHAGALHVVDAAAAQITAQRSVDQSRRLGSIDWKPRGTTLLTDDTALVERARDRGAVGAAAQCIGVAQRLLDLTVAYVAEREQFGKPVGVHQGVKHHLSNVAIAVEFARPLVNAAAWSLAHDEPTVEGGSVSQAASMAKAEASDCVDLACRNALQCHGAIGYTIEYDLQLWLKRGWALAASWGSAPYHRRRLATSLGLV